MNKQQWDVFVSSPFDYLEANKEVGKVISSLYEEANKEVGKVISSLYEEARSEVLSQVYSQVWAQVNIDNNKTQPNDTKSH